MHEFLANIGFIIVIMGLGLGLPTIVKKSKLLSKMISPTALDVTQGAILAYGLLFGVILPLTSYIGTGAWF